MKTLMDPIEAVTEVIDQMVSGKSAVGDGGKVLPISEFAVPAQAGLLLESAAADVAPRSWAVGGADGVVVGENAVELPAGLATSRGVGSSVRELIRCCV